MSGATGLDLRLPIGGLFAVLGVMLAAYGAATNGNVARYARSGGLNINLWWGLVLLATGVVLGIAGVSRQCRTSAIMGVALNALGAVGYLAWVGMGRA